MDDTLMTTNDSEDRLRAAAEAELPDWTRITARFEEPEAEPEQRPAHRQQATPARPVPSTSTPNLAAPAEEELPAWTRLRADISDDDDDDEGLAPVPPVQVPSARPAAPAPAPRPVRPAPQMPAPQRPVAVPAPQRPVTAPARQPAPTAAPVAVPQVPQQPMYVPVPAPTYVPRPSTPAPALTPSTAPAYAPAPEPVQTPAAPVAAVQDPVPPAPSSALRRTLRRQGTNRPAEPQSPKRSVTAGGRWKVLALRTGIWVVLGVIALSGIRNTLFPQHVSVAQLSTQVGQTLGFNGFPITPAETLAQRFVTDYLTVDPAEPFSARSARLAQYLVKGTEAPPWPLGEATTSGQRVTVAPALAEAPDLLDKDRAAFTYGAQVTRYTVDDKGNRTDTSTAWLYVSVSVAADATGNVAVAGQPGFVAGPAQGTSNGVYKYAVDPKATTSFAEDLPGFFTAWAASDTAGLSRYLDRDKNGTITASPEAQAGMGAAVQFAKLNESAVSNPNADGHTRFAEASVTWQSGGVNWKQQYRLTVRQGDDGTWYISDISGAGFGAIPSAQG